jgi:hypothetical protein
MAHPHLLEAAEEVGLMEVFVRAQVTGAPEGERPKSGAAT